MMKMTMFAAMVSVVALAACTGMEARGPADPGVDGPPMPRSAVTSQLCEPFAVQVVVPDERTTAPELQVVGTERITQGCPPFFRAFFEEGARDGEVWVVFGGRHPQRCNPSVTPFMDANQRPVCEFNVEESGRLQAWPHAAGRCVRGGGCKYDVEHRAAIGDSPYPVYDPHIIIIH